MYLDEIDPTYSTPYYPSAGGSDYAPSPSAPAPDLYSSVQTGVTNAGASVSGVLGAVGATAESLLKVWGGIQAVDMQRERMQLDRQIAQGQIQVQSVRADTERDLAMLQADTTRQVETARAGAQIAKAQADADAARLGKFVMPAQLKQISPEALIGGVALLATVLFVARNKGKAK